MHATRRVLLVIAVGVLLSMPPLVLAASDTAGLPRSAMLRSQHDLPSTHVRDQYGHIVLLRLRALVPQNIKVSDPAQGTVRATVMAIDEATNQVKIQTQEGQRLVLYLAPESLEGMRVGQQFLLQVAQRSAP